jgi:hypothetical protein
MKLFRLSRSESMSSETSGQLAKLLANYDRFLDYERKLGGNRINTESLNVIIDWLDDKEVAFLGESRRNTVEYLISWFAEVVQEMMEELAQRIMEEMAQRNDN